MVDVYKPTTQFLRNMYGHLGRTDYVPQDELDDRCAAFDRWLAEEIRKAKHVAFAEGIYQAETDLEEGRETFTNPYDKED